MSSKQQFEGVFSELHPDHADVLLERGIKESEARWRGYRTVATKTELQDLGFSKAQSSMVAQDAPVLVIPLHGPDGEVVNYQARPNKPRVKKSAGGKKEKVLKYEVPYGKPLAIVCPADPHQRRSLKATVPLFITESVLKADAALGLGLLTIGILGLDGWRAKNELDGVTAHAHWEQINLKRDVYVIPDSDLGESRRVRTSLRRFKRWLESKGGNVKIILLPPMPDGSKCGLDDFIALRRAQGRTDDEIKTELLRHAVDEIPGEEEFQSEGEKEIERLTDLGNAKRLVALYGADLRYCHQWGRWLCGTAGGGRWTIPRPSIGWLRRRCRASTARRRGLPTPTSARKLQGGPCLPSGFRG